MKLIFRFKGLLKSRKMTFKDEEDANLFLSELEDKSLVNFGNEILNAADIKKIIKRF